jgi:hypothetical protein
VALPLGHASVTISRPVAFAHFSMSDQAHIHMAVRLALGLGNPRSVVSNHERRSHVPRPAVPLSLPSQRGRQLGAASQRPADVAGTDDPIGVGNGSGVEPLESPRLTFGDASRNVVDRALVPSVAAPLRRGRFA